MAAVGARSKANRDRDDDILRWYADCVIPKQKSTKNRRGPILTKSHFLRLGQNRRLSGSLRRHAPLLLTRIARVDSLVSQLIRDLEGELKLAVRQVTVFLDDG